MGLFQQTLQSVLQLDPVAGQLVLSAHYGAPQSLFGIGHKAQGQLLGHEPLHQPFRIVEILLPSLMTRDSKRYSPWASRSTSNGSRFNMPSGAMMNRVAAAASGMGFTSTEWSRFESSTPVPLVRISPTNSWLNFSISLRPAGSARTYA